MFIFYQSPAFLQNYHNIIEFIVCCTDIITSLFPSEATDFTMCLVKPIRPVILSLFLILL